jgi:hypothetical protein
MILLGQYRSYRDLQILSARLGLGGTGKYACYFFSLLCARLLLDQLTLAYFFQT